MNQQKLIRKSLMNHTKPMLNLKTRPKSLLNFNNSSSRGKAPNKRGKWILLAYSFSQYKNINSKNRNNSLSVPKISQNMNSLALDEKELTVHSNSKRNTASSFNFPFGNRDRRKDSDLRSEMSHRKENSSILKDIKDQKSKLEQKMHNTRSFTLSRQSRRRRQRTPSEEYMRLPSVKVKNILSKDEKNPQENSKTIIKDDAKTITAMSKLSTTVQIVSKVGSKLRVNLKSDNSMATSKNKALPKAIKRPKKSKIRSNANLSCKSIIDEYPKTLSSPVEPENTNQRVQSTTKKREVLQRILTTDYARNETKINLKNILKKYQKYKTPSDESQGVYRSKTMGRLEEVQNRGEDYRKYRDYLKY
ncbi:unnamed protein product [Moneuplotes crassus]|uniref:Uncharacterized protein n=1 Tax=Euplotes crassus TaxID=5936 RepID=A0AAD1U750_EUPCR|nr:unnamed protein product [Moneuplotes crassus]